MSSDGKADSKLHPNDVDLRKKSGRVYARFRNAAFTSWVEPTLDSIISDGRVTYIVYKKELCPKTSREHWQGYVELRRQLAASTLKRIITPGRNDTHFQERYPDATAADNIAYVKKEETAIGPVVEYGQPNNPGRRRDIEFIVDELRRGVRTDDTAHLTYELRHGSSYNMIRNRYVKPPPRPDIHIYIFQGGPGSGKSYVAPQLWPEAYYAEDHETGYFDNYEGQEVIVFQEFACRFPYRVLLQLLDRYPLRIRKRYGTVPIYAKTVVFTTNFDSKSWYVTRRDSDTSALQRRLKDFATIIQWDKKYDDMNEAEKRERGDWIQNFSSHL